METRKVLADKSQPVLLGNQAASAYIGVTPNLLRLSRSTVELFKVVPGPNYLKLGTAIRYSRASLDEWVCSQRQFANTTEVALTGAA